MSLIDFKRVREYYGWSIAKMANRLNIAELVLMGIEDRTIDPTMIDLKTLKQILIEE